MSQGKIKLVLYFCFFLSGISGLVYEVLWAKYLALIFGNTAYAHTLVLAVFMGGLALGSYLLGRLADKISDKLGFYGWIEIGIAVFSIFTPVMFIFSKNIYLSAAKIFSTPAIIVTAKFIIGVLIMLPPTILMGGTLPILNKLIRESLLACENSVARLYYINSFGAVVGTLLAGFYLIYKFGMEFSVIIAVFINLFCGLTVLILSKFFVKEKELIAKKKEIINQDSVDIYYGENKKILNISLIAIFLSGFAAMLYEIVWIRLLSTILGSSTYAFSLMIASFILGITIGSYLISKLAIKSKFTFFFFGLCEILIGILVIVSLPFYEKLPFLFAKLLGIFSRKPETFVFYSIIQFFLSSLVMLPSTIFLGMTLPLVSRLFSGKVEFLGKRIGNVFALNTSGNILGAVISGLFLMPWLGVKSTLEIGVIINLFLGSLILFVDKNCSLKYKISFVSIVFFLFTVYKISIPDWNRIYFTAQLFRPRASEANLLKKGNILYYKDGLDGTVAVTKKNDTIALYVNGKADASSTADMPTQVLSAQIPLIIKPDSQNVLIVGLGSGVTCGSVLLHPVDSLDLVEISSSVVEANKYFSEVNYNVLKNQRLHLHIEDAKTFLQRTEKNMTL